MKHFKDHNLQKAAQLLEGSQYLVAFTGAGISAESGIPTFRGEGGIWDRYDPIILDIEYFKQNAAKAWPKIKEMFYKTIDKAQPNPAHKILAQWEKRGLLKSTITQNIDNLHQKAGQKQVIEFHGNTRDLICLNCNKKWPVKKVDFNQNPVKCPVCGGILKPDFVFFGEPIPSQAYQDAVNATLQADLYILIGTTGIIMPASLLPYEAKKNGAKILEINLEPSNYTNTITDIFLQGKAGQLLPALEEILLNKNK